MASASQPDTVCVVSGERRLTTTELSALAAGGAGLIAASGAGSVGYVGTGGDMLPLLLFASARAARAFAPLNYRHSRDTLRQLIDRLPDPLIVFDPEYAAVNDGGVRAISSADYLAAASRTQPAEQFADPDSVAVLLFTSGTTSKPKAVELSHNNLTSYVTGTVEFGSAAADETALICVPPYHIAGISAVLSNLYAARKTVYLTNFDPAEWISLVRAERITTATVVPTMLDRIIAILERDPAGLPTLRNLVYGGSKVGLPLIRKALRMLPDVGFVNAYGLTETSSTISVLSPADHREYLDAATESDACRLASVGQPLPGVEIQIRDAQGRVLRSGEVGELYVRGNQVSGRYSGLGSALDADGWFATKDIASVDAGGYLFIRGRSDDTIIRGGENIAPAEIEDVLIEHPDVHDVAVVGVYDAHWGQAIIAVVVPEAGTAPDADELRQHVRRALRGSRTPDRIAFRQALPTGPTGKVLRRAIVEELSDANPAR